MATTRMGQVQNLTWICAQTQGHLRAERKGTPSRPKLPQLPGTKKALSCLKGLDVVPGAGIEPARLAAGDFESPASTNFTTRAAGGKREIMAQWCA
jgi:hypothetical protein